MSTKQFPYLLPLIAMNHTYHQNFQITTHFEVDLSQLQLGRIYNSRYLIRVSTILHVYLVVTESHLR